MFGHCCAQPFGEAEYWAERKGVGALQWWLCGAGCCGRSHIPLQQQNCRQRAGGDPELLLPFAHFCLHVPWKEDLCGLYFSYVISGRAKAKIAGRALQYVCA